MLLEFRTKNYKSFKDELVFSMIPAQKQKGLDYSILKEKIGKTTYKGLSSAVIYGANASGKTNIIGAMDTFKNIILRGNINNTQNNSPNTSAENLELIPNNELTSPEPVSFCIKFIEKDMLIEYALSIDLGIFLGKNYERKIEEEYLNINDKPIFERKDKLAIEPKKWDKSIKKYLVNEFTDDDENIIAIAKNNLNSKELFLMNSFKAMFSAKIVDIITEWLSNKFRTIYSADTLKTIPMLNNYKKGKIYIADEINEITKVFSGNSNKLGYISDGENKEANLYSIFENGDIITTIPAEVFESYGTIRFINLFPLIADALISGGTLVVDEFDASIHPIALMDIVNIFHNDEININHAQLIFNTHNPIFLNSNLFRRDEIKFVERDEDTHYSTHYSLSDFGTSGKGGVRNNEDYMKNYFIDRYGAIRDIDFTTVFENILKDKEI